jgi:galacturan 1,4-alpha-galacturonidase
MRILGLLILAVLHAVAAAVSSLDHTAAEKTCEVPLSGKGGDDTAAILSAFGSCGKNGRIVFGAGTYHVNKVMTTTGLENVRIELKGTIKVSYVLWGLAGTLDYGRRVNDAG